MLERYTAWRDNKTLVGCKTGSTYSTDYHYDGIATTSGAATERITCVDPDKPGQLIGFVDAAHANDFCCCRSTTGYAFLLNFGVISYRSKTQSTTATSSTEAEFLAAVTAAKHTKYIYLSFWKAIPTSWPYYENNMSAINMINNCVPTDWSLNINIQLIAI